MSFATKGKARANASTSQAVLSSYFSQGPKSSPIRRGRQATSSPQTVDLTVLDDSDSDAELWRNLGETPPPAKKRKLEHRQTTPSDSRHDADRSPEPSAEATGVQRFRFNGSSSSSHESQPVNQEIEHRKHQWHNRAKKILLANSSVFQRQLGDGDSQEPPPSDDEEDEEDVAEDSQENSTIDFEELMSQYTNPSRGKGAKGKKKASAQASSSKAQSAGRSSTRRAVQVGPSGKAYTPLELQVGSGSDIQHSL